MGIKLKPHNEKAYDQVVEMFKTENRAAIIHPTGTGKTWIAAKLVENNERKKVIYLAPSINILHQFKKILIENGIKFNDGKNKTVERFTYQKLLQMLKNNELNLNADIIVLDEFHHCGAPEWGKAIEELLKQNPNAKVLGLSATPIRYFDENIRDMAEELFDGKVASEMTFTEAIEQGILNEYTHIAGINDSSKIIQEYERKIEKNPNEEKKEKAKRYLTQLRRALDDSVNGVSDLLEKNMTNKTGRYIVYCKDIKDMQEQMANVQSTFGKVNSEIEVYCVSSRRYDSTDKMVNISETQNMRQIRRFETAQDNGKLKLLFCVDMLNEGWHYPGLDGAIMLRPTSSPTLFAQQLGRILSVENNKKTVVIDLVNNADSIRIIENFYKELGKSKGKRVKSVLDGIKVTESVKDVRAIMEKLDSLVGRRAVLSNEEKLNLMLEYLDSIEGTDETFSVDSVYKGYNIGKMRSNLRASYWNGTLKIADETLKKFMEKGIIIEKPERIRTSTEEKYEFLVSMIGKDEEELKQARMYSGLTYDAARNHIQHSYNTGKLNLKPEQIHTLKQNGILHLSAQEKEELSKQYNFSQRDIAKILKEYSSLEEFIEKLKSGEIDYEFQEDTFVGERVLIVSKNPMTVEQKKVICSLAKAVGRSYMDFHRYLYINVDELYDSFRMNLNNREQEILALRFGLNGDNPVACRTIGELFGLSPSRVAQIEKRTLRKLCKYAGKIFIQDEDIDEINKQLAEIQIQEDGIAKLEEILILLYENDSIETDNLKLNLSEDQIEYLEQQYGFSELKTGKSLLNLREDLEHRLSNYYYYGLNEDISKRKTLEAKKERHERFVQNFSKLKERYLKEEDIFDPECVIPGIEIEQIKPVKDIQPDQIESISSLGISIDLLIYLHHFGLETIQDVKDLSENNEKMAEFLDKIQDESIRKNLKEMIEKHKGKESFLKKWESNPILDLTLEELDLKAATFTVLKRNRLVCVRDILDYAHYTETGDLRLRSKLRNFGRSRQEEVLNRLYKLGIIDEDGKITGITKNDTSQFILQIANAAQRRVDARIKAKKSQELLQEYEEKSLLGKDEKESSLET